MTILTTTSRPVPNPSGLVGTIENIAKSLGVDPNLALATAITESNLNPNAVGDNGTSFGLFQLHQGGELGNLTSSQAFNVVTYATTALTTFAGVMAANPGNGFDGTSFQTPGALAAASQRPANQSAYATEVNYYYNQLAGGLPVNQVTSYGGNTQAIAGNASGVAGLTIDQVPGGSSSSSSGGCSAKTGSNSAEPNQIFTIPHTTAGLTYCNLKAITGGTILVAGGIVMLLGAALISVSALGRSVPGVAGAAVGFIGGRETAPKAVDVPTPDTQIPASAKTTTYTDTGTNYSGGRARRGAGRIAPDDEPF